MKTFKRTLQIQKYLKNNKVLVIYGPRQVGKTTLVKKYLQTYTKTKKYYTGDDLEFADALSKCNLEILKKMFSGLSLLVIDEAQKIENIGRAIKLLVDNIENIKVILTGSSSFDLANKTSETLTGRKHIVTMYPISFNEMLSVDSEWTVEQNLPELLIYGSYPKILLMDTYEEKTEKLREIMNSYLLKDILSFKLLHNSKVIRNLLKLLAFQVGSEVSLNELASNLDIDKNTVARYIDLLEKSFVIFSLGGFSKNLRKEVSKSQKYYFYDLGIRNILISNLNSLENRDDIGKLWENFLIIERIKNNDYASKYPNYYFWRTYDKKEIDFIEETGGELHAYEFKWKKNLKKKSNEFLKEYDNSTLNVINRENYNDFLKN